MLSEQVVATVTNPNITRNFPSLEEVLSVKVLERLTTHFGIEQFTDEDSQLYVLELVQADTECILEARSEDEECNSMFISLLREECIRVLRGGGAVLLLAKIPLQKLVGLDLVHSFFEECHHDILFAEQHIPKKAVEWILCTLVFGKCNPLNPLANMLDILVPKHSSVLCEQTPAELVLLLPQGLFDQQLEGFFFVVRVHNPTQLLRREALGFVHPQVTGLANEDTRKIV